MVALRVFLVLWLTLMVAYTHLVIAHDGVDFLTPFHAAVARVGWEGQFSLDLAGFLVVTAFWITWRQGASLLALLTALVVVSGGMIGVCAYLLIIGMAARGDVKVLLLGPGRARSA